MSSVVACPVIVVVVTLARDSRNRYVFSWVYRVSSVRVVSCCTHTQNKKTVV